MIEKGIKPHSIGGSIIKLGPDYYKTVFTIPDQIPEWAILGIRHDAEAAGFTYFTGGIATGGFNFHADMDKEVIKNLWRSYSLIESIRKSLGTVLYDSHKNTCLVKDSQITILWTSMEDTEMKPKIDGGVISEIWMDICFPDKYTA